MRQYNDTMIISVCISTYKRPEYLRLLLEEINDQEAPEGCRLVVIIIDNDPNRSSENIVNSYNYGYRHSLVYDVENRRGIPFSRNKAVGLADENSEFIIFIDDDSYPGAYWIKKLIEIQMRFDCDLVEGIVIPVYNDKTPSWVLCGDFFSMPHYKSLFDGEELPMAAVITNNLMIRYSMLRRLEGPFDETMALTGASDSELGLRLHLLGCKMIFTNKAKVYEHIPQERTTLRWILQRGFRTGNTFWKLSPVKDYKNFIKVLGLGIARLIFGIVLLVPSLFASLFLGIQYFYKILRAIARGCGIITGLFGFKYQEYRSSYTFNKAITAESQL